MVAMIKGREDGEALAKLRTTGDPAGRHDRQGGAVDDPARLGQDVGVDETSFLQATAKHPT